MPTWSPRMYAMPFDQMAHAAVFEDHGEGSWWKHAHGRHLHMGIADESKTLGKPMRRAPCR